MGYLLYPLPMRRYNNPLELLQKMQAIGTSKKSSMEGAFSYASGTACMNLFGSKVGGVCIVFGTVCELGTFESYLLTSLILQLWRG